MNRALRLLSDLFLRDGAYIHGSSQPTLADLWSYSEVKSLELVGYSIDAFPAVVAYCSSMSFVPHHADLFAVHTKITAKLDAKRRAKAQQGMKDKAKL